jgi:hypothetical protein
VPNLTATSLWSFDHGAGAAPGSAAGGAEVDLPRCLPWSGGWLGDYGSVLVCSSWLTGGR